MFIYRNEASFVLGSGERLTNAWMLARAAEAFLGFCSVCRADGGSVLCEGASLRARHWVALGQGCPLPPASGGDTQTSRPPGTSDIKTGNRGLQIILQHSLEQLIS